MISVELSKHMAAIGALGGSKRASHPDRKIFAREAGRISWSPEARAKRLSNKCTSRRKIARQTENKVEEIS